MAITHDTQSQKSSSAWTSATGGVAQTWTHTMASGSGGYLIVTVRHVNNNGDRLGSASAVTYAGVNMTRLYSTTTNWDGSHRMYIYGLANPATGANTVSVTLSTSQANCSFEANSFLGVASAGQPDATGAGNVGSAAAASITVNITTVADNCWIAGSIGNSSAGTLNTHTNCVSRQYNTGTGSSTIDSNGAQTPAGAKSVTEGISTTAQWESIIVSLKPLTTSIKTFDGLVYASTKTVDSLALASVKTWDGLA